MGTGGAEPAGREDEYSSPGSFLLCYPPRGSGCTSGASVVSIFSCPRIEQERKPAMSQLIDPAVARQFDRLPPHSIEAEMCLLASMMLDKEMIGQAVQLIDRESFYQADHQIIYRRAGQAVRDRTGRSTRSSCARNWSSGSFWRKSAARDTSRRFSTPSPPPPMGCTTPGSSAKRRCCGN